MEEQAATPPGTPSGTPPTTPPQTPPGPPGTPPATPPESGSKKWLWVAGIVALLVLVGAWFFIGQGAQVETPAVVGLSEEAARASIASAGLSVGRVSEEPTLGAEPGTVTNQSPKPGVEVAEGSAVDLDVAAIPIAEVPDVVGDSQEEATAKLAQEGLILDDVEYVYDADTEAGFVTAQDPEAGQEIEVGSTVALTVSKGEESGKVPNVVGLSQDDAKSALSAAGFESKTTKEQSADVDAGDVIEQSPAAGTSVAVGSMVTLTVSSGAPAEPEPEAEEPTEPEAEAPTEPEAEEPTEPETPEEPEAPEAVVTVPDVVGMGIFDAIGAIRDADLKIAFAWVPDDDNILSVSSTDPAAGTEVDPGTTVTLSIGLPEFLLSEPVPPATTEPTPEQQPATSDSSAETSTP